MSKPKALKLLKFYLEQGEITEETYSNARKWLTRPEYAEFKDEVIDLIRPVGLSDAFYTLIPFGTGGRRGQTGAGTNRINARTIGESAQGLANTILKLDKNGELKKRGVVVAFDVRITSGEFATITAEVLAAAGIKTYLFDAPRPTPMLSFAIRNLGCVSGVIITASHNPPSDNGFKAYWEDGGQVVPPNDKKILAEVKKVRTISRMPLDKAAAKKLVVMVGSKEDEAYFEKMKTLNYYKGRKAKIVFSPLHGTGVASVPRVLADLGFKNVHMPPDQVEMNGRFPTIKDNYPNPEIPAAMDRAVKLGKEIGADVVMASDPDADRLGVFVPDGTGEFVYLTGNQVGSMLCHFICEQLLKNKAMPDNPFMLTTLVSTRLVRAIGDSFGVAVRDDLLVGFKWMAEVLSCEEEKGRPLSDFIFSFEESIGFMIGAFVRDKDAAAGASVLAQLTAYCVAKKISLMDYLNSIYEKYGYFKEHQFSTFLRGAAGNQMMDALMKNLRENPPEKIGSHNVHAFIDRETGQYLDMGTRQTSDVVGTRGNVLVYFLDKQGFTSVTMRPSGTEPKIKHYISAYAPMGKNLAATRKKVDQLVKELSAATEALEENILAKGKQ